MRPVPGQLSAKQLKAPEDGQQAESEVLRHLLRQCGSYCIRVDEAAGLQNTNLVEIPLARAMAKLRLSRPSCVRTRWQSIRWR